MYSTLQIPRLVVRSWDPFDLGRKEHAARRTVTERPMLAAPVAAPLSVWEDERGVYIEVDVPGLQPDDVDVRIEDGTLRISGERSPLQREQKCWYEERSFGRFERIIGLADTVDPSTVEASLRDGVLRLTLHKRPEAQPQRVTVRYAANGQAGQDAAEHN